LKEEGIQTLKVTLSSYREKVSILEHDLEIKTKKLESVLGDLEQRELQILTQGLSEAGNY